MATPIMNLPEWLAAQASPWITVMTALTRLEAYGQSVIVCVDTTLNTPPVSPSPGDCYFIAATATGAWASHDSEVTVYTGSSWEFLAPREGWFIYDLNLSNTFQVNDTGGLNPLAFASLDALTTLDVITTTLGTYVPTVSNGNKQYIVNNSSSVNTFELPSDATQNFPVGTALTFEQGGTGVSEITAGSGASINARGGALEFAGQYAVATAVKKAANTWTVTGDLIV